MKHLTIEGTRRIPPARRVTQSTPYHTPGRSTVTKQGLQASKSTPTAATRSAHRD